MVISWTYNNEAREKTIITTAEIMPISLILLENIDTNV